MYIYVDICISSHNWSMIHRVLKCYRSKMGVVYMESWKQLLSWLSLQCLCCISWISAHDVQLDIAGTNESKSAQEAKQRA